MGYFFISLLFWWWDVTNATLKALYSRLYVSNFKDFHYRLLRFLRYRWIIGNRSDWLVANLYLLNGMFRHLLAVPPFSGCSVGGEHYLCLVNYLTNWLSNWKYSRLPITRTFIAREFTTSEPMTRERSHDFCQTPPLTRRVVFAICTSAWTPKDDLFPNIYPLLKICATIPATSYECERSESSLRQLHTYNRACMGQERLSSLALMHIHYQAKIVLDEVVNLFATKHPRRLELGTILRD